MSLAGWLAILLGASGAALAVTGDLGRRGKLKRNGLAGIRISATMSSDEAWYAAHRVAGPYLLACGVISMIGALVLAIWRPSDAVASIVALVVVAVEIVPMSRATRLGRRAAIEVG